ncbi:MAG: general secretion pathway protein GspH [Gammaproteobacteria bacterium]|nr:MAG: general secretion pathway protein GspH [Gammaproteobacteria bacterium]
MFRTGQQDGFTLLEVLVAFAIASAALILLMQAFSDGLRLAGRAEDYSRATVMAESLLIRAGPEFTLEESPYSGRFDDRFNWVLELDPYPMDEGLTESAVAAVKIEVAVSWKNGRQQRNYELSSLRLMPLNPK